jgi:hypothetical protein
VAGGFEGDLGVKFGVGVLTEEKTAKAPIPVPVVDDDTVPHIDRGRVNEVELQPEDVLGEDALIPGSPRDPTPARPGDRPGRRDFNSRVLHYYGLGSWGCQATPERCTCLPETEGDVGHGRSRFFATSPGHSYDEEKMSIT